MLAKFMAAFLYPLALRQENVFFYDLVFSWRAFGEKSDQYIYLYKHDALRSMKQGSCITEATLIEIGVSFVSRCGHLSCRSRRFDCLLLVFVRR